MNFRARIICLRILVVLSAGFLALGLLAPSMTITPGFGEYEALVELLRPDMTEPTTYSIYDGIMELITGDDFWLGVLLIVFSILFPTWKLIVYWNALGQEDHHRIKGTWADHLGKFSMVDVFVIALLVLAIKGLPGGTTIDIRWGLWMFCASVVLSLIVAATRPAPSAQ